MNSLIVRLSLLLLSAPLQAIQEYPDASELIRELDIEESSIPSREMPGWSRPTKIAIQLHWDLAKSGPGSAEWVREATDGVEVEFLQPSDQRPGRFSASEVYVGVCDAEALNDRNKLAYVHLIVAGLDSCMRIPGISELQVIATNSAAVYGDTMAEHSIALLLTLTRNLLEYHKLQLDSEWRRSLEHGVPASISLKGKTMLVLGLGGVGTQVARRAHDLGMRVIATRASSRSGPDFVELVGLSDETIQLAAQADVVVNALPLVPMTHGLVNAEFFDALKNGSYYISVGRGGTTNTDALVAALSSGKLAGAGLDVTDPEPLPEGHKLWKLPNVIITPHVSADSDQSIRNMWVITRENLRRYVHGERLLNIVDLTRGY